MVQKEKSAKEGQTQAGIVTVEPSIREIIGKPPEDRFKTYHVYLQPSGSSEKRKIGYVNFQYCEVGDISAKNSTEYTALIENKLRNEDRVVYISGFYPLPLHEEAEFNKNRIGTAVLSQLLKEFESKEVIGVSCSARGEGMQRLLGEFGFQKIGENVYFKRFG